MRRKLLGTMMALAMAGMIVVPTIKVEAAGLTQAKDPSKVKYEAVTADETQILKSIFDLEYYKAQNPDVVAAFGDNYDILFKHFCTYGVFEGRVCNENFDPAAYASAYSDLKEEFGSNILKYYEHYVSVGKAENRTYTTIEACANSGITVVSLSGEAARITPQIFKAAKALGTEDYGTVAYVVNVANSGGSSGGGVVASSTALAPEVMKAKGLTYAGTVTAGDGSSIHLYVIKGSSEGYGAYTYTGSFSAAPSFDNTKLIKATSGYQEPSDFTPIASVNIFFNALQDGGIVVTPNVDPSDTVKQTSSETSGTQIESTDDSENSSYVMCVDKNGDADTEYKVGLDIEATGSGVNLVVGTYNEADNFGYVKEYSIEDTSTSDNGEGQ